MINQIGLHYYWSRFDLLPFINSLTLAFKSSQLVLLKRDKITLWIFKLFMINQIKAKSKNLKKKKSFRKESNANLLNEKATKRVKTQMSSKFTFHLLAQVGPSR